MLVFMLTLSGCSLIPPNNGQLKQDMTTNLERNELRSAYNNYQRLSSAAKKQPDIIKLHQRLLQKIAQRRDNTVQQARLAADQGDWPKASGLYDAQRELIAIDEAFKQQYQRFVKSIELQKAPVRNDFLIIEAQYLIEKRAMLRRINQIDPYDRENKTALADTEQQAKTISKLLLAQGLEAFQDNNINIARKLIPLAQALDNSKTVRKATRVLEKLTRPMEDYIAKLTDYGTELYSNEDYSNAYEIWEVILYLDPNNEKVQANKERTLKVLESLEKIKQHAIDNGHTDNGTPPPQ